MSRTIVGLMFLLMALNLAPSANAEERFYIKGGVGFFKPEDGTIGSNQALADAVLRSNNLTISGQTSFTWNVGAGYKISDAFRLEGEFASFRSSLNQAHSNIGTDNLGGYARAYATMLNGYYDIPIKEVPIVPYIGFGVGAAFHKADITTINGASSGLSPGHDTTFAYNVKGGLSYNITERFVVDAGYRYFATPDANYGFLTSSIALHSFELSLRWFAF